MSVNDAFPLWCEEILRDGVTRYEVLGLDLFEDNQQRICEAGNRHMRTIWQHLMGPHARLARRARQRVDQASRCLSNPRSKAKYDEALRRERNLPKPSPISCEINERLAEPSLVSAWASAAERETNRSLVIASCALLAGLALVIGVLYSPLGRSPAKRDVVVKEVAVLQPLPPTPTREVKVAKPAESDEVIKDSAPASIEVASPSRISPARNDAPARRPNHGPKSLEDLVDRAKSLPNAGNQSEPPAKRVEVSVTLTAVLKQSVLGTRSVAISQDGRRLVTGSWDQTVRLWDLNTGVQRRQYAKLVDSVLAVAISADNRLVAAGTADGVVLIWDLESGEEVRRLEGHKGSVNAIAFSHDGTCVVTGGNDQTLRIWNLTTNVEVPCKGSTRWMSVAYSTDDRFVLAGGRDGTVTLWDIQTGLLNAEFKGHSAAVHSVAFISSAREIVSASWDGTIRVWNADSLKEDRRLTGDSLCLAVSGDGTQIVTGREDGTLQRWDLRKDRPIGAVVAHQRRVARVLFIGNSKEVLSLGWDNLVRRWPYTAEQKPNEDSARP